MEDILDKKQAIKNIVKDAELCEMKNVEFFVLKNQKKMIVVPVLYAVNRATIEDLYTQKSYTRQSGFFASIPTAEKLCNEYHYNDPLLKNAEYKILGSFVGVKNAIEKFYNTYGVTSAYEFEYQNLTKKLASYNYHSQEQKSNVVKLANDIQTFLGGASLIKEKIKTPEFDDNKKEALQMSM